MNPIIAGLSLFRVLTPNTAWRLGVVGGALGHVLARRERKRARAHLAKAFPDADAQWIRNQVAGMFHHVGGMALWTLSSLKMDPHAIGRGVAVEGKENLRDLYRASMAGRGTLVYTAHYGNWELMGRLGGTYLPTSVVGKQQRNPTVDAAVKWLRTSTGAEQIDQHEGMRPCVRALRNGRLVACLADQDVPALPGMFVPWFGELAHTPSGPAALAQLCRVDAQVLLCFRRAGRWVIHIGPRWAFTKGADREQAALELTKRFTDYFATLVAREPRQWMWWHKRWRIRPSDRPDAAVWKDNA